ncbi:transmembrane protein 161B isoform X3 [Hydra vulgaris]|uniref:Transmembrane protein 161B isoform X3 n=1 Tax=Hydra vulgaris TaxID=6087 RepID=A0ABM4BBS8_HYDVU
MALLGMQFLTTLIISLFMVKLSSFYSIARWIICGKLYRYLHPTNEHLRSLVGKLPLHSKGKKRKSNEKYNTETMDMFTIPCSLEFQLERVSIEEIDLYPQYKYHDFKWLVDFSVCAALIYVIIELIGIYRPDIYIEEFNLGVVWCGMVVYFCLKELFSLTSAYWKTEDDGERSMTLSFGIFFFIVAMGVLIIDESVMDFGLEKGFYHFVGNLEIVCKRLNFSVKQVPSIWVFKISLAILSSLVGAVLCFPGIRYANMYIESLNYSKSSWSYGLINLVFFSPLFLSLLWILPLSKSLIVTKNSISQQQHISDETFLYLRIHLTILICFLRLLVTRQFLQSYLNLACKKVEKLKKETGRITNIELQRTIARVFYYLSAAALQYITPLILVLFLSLMVRTLTYHVNDSTDLSGFQTNNTLPVSKEEYVKMMRGLFSVKLINAICSYFSWWVLNVFFITSAFGSVYLKLKV